MRNRNQVVKIYITLLVMVFCFQACTLFGVKGNSQSDVVAVYGAIGNKILNTKKTIVNECTTHILISESDCIKAKQYYNMSVDVYDISGDLLNASIDTGNEMKHLDAATAKIAPMLGKSYYIAEMKATVSSIRNIITVMYVETDNLDKTKQVLTILENELINTALIILQKSASDGGIK